MESFNSKEYSYCDIQVTLLGRPLLGLRGIEYKTKKAKAVLHGAGIYGRSVQHGKREYEGTLTVLQSELIALDRAAQEAGLEDCLDLDFDIVITYLNRDAILSTDIVKVASLTESSRGMKEGDLNMEVSLPFIALKVVTNLI